MPPGRPTELQDLRQLPGQSLPRRAFRSSSPTWPHSAVHLDVVEQLLGLLSECDVVQRAETGWAECHLSELPLVETAASHKDGQATRGHLTTLAAGPAQCTCLSSSGRHTETSSEGMGLTLATVGGLSFCCPVRQTFPDSISLGGA